MEICNLKKAVRALLRVCLSSACILHACLGGSLYVRDISDEETTTDTYGDYNNTIEYEYYDNSSLYDYRDFEVIGIDSAHRLVLPWYLLGICVLVFQTLCAL